MFTFSTSLQNCSSGNLDMKFPPENSQPKQHTGARDNFYTETQTVSHFRKPCACVSMNHVVSFSIIEKFLDPLSHKTSSRWCMDISIFLKLSIGCVVLKQLMPLYLGWKQAPSSVMLWGKHPSTTVYVTSYPTFSTSLQPCFCPPCTRSQRRSWHSARPSFHPTLPPSHSSSPVTSACRWTCHLSHVAGPGEIV